MRKRTRKTEDPIETALRVVRQAVGDESFPKVTDETAAVRSRIAAELGRLGGLRGGRVRAARMSPEARSESASKAAIARWQKTAKARSGG